MNKKNKLLVKVFQLYSFKKHILDKLSHINNINNIYTKESVDF